MERFTWIFTSKKKGERKIKVIIITRLLKNFFSIGEKIGWIGFRFRKFVEERKEEGKAFRGKRNFIMERSIFERKWGEEKSFLDRVEATASMQQTSILNRITHTR